MRVLLIEDDEDDALLVRGMLAEVSLQSYGLDWVESYEAGLEAMRRGGHDVCLLDYRLGGHNGLELLHDAVTAGYRVPVIFLTGLGDYGIDLEAMRAGAADYLVKGQLNPDLLDRSIRYAMERKKVEYELRRVHDHLEELVRERTAQLESTNERLLREIEERRRAQEAQRRSEAEYRRLFEESRDAIFITTRGGRVLDANPAALDLFGYTREEVIGKFNVAAVYAHSEDRMRFQREIEGKGSVWDFEVELLKRDGTIMHCLLTATVRRSEEGAILGYEGVVRDITRQKRAEEQILQQNAFLNTVIEALTHPFYVLDARDYTVKMANSAAAPSGVAPGTTCHALTHRRDTPCGGGEHFCPLQEIKRTGQPFTVEHVHYDAQGLPRHVEVHGYPIFDQQGRVAQIIEYSLDITERKQMEEALRQARDELEMRVRERTAELAAANEALQEEVAERKQAEEALRRSEEKYRELVEHANSIILRMDAMGRITFFNEFAQRFFGFPEEELLGRSVLGTIVPRTESSGRDLAGMIESILHHPEQYAVNENENMRRNGERVWVTWTNKPIFDTRGGLESILCIGNDITARKQAEEALRLDEARLEALFELSQMRDVSVKQIADFVLEEQVKLTKSRVGWIGLMDEEEKVLTLHAWSRDAMGRCAVQGEPVRFPVENGGLWAEAIQARREVVINDYATAYPYKRVYPEGHIPLERFMSIPVFEGDRIVAVAAVANKADPYDASDVRQLTLLMDGMWKLIQRERAEEALRQAEGLAAMGRALSSLAHDIKTPLVAIGGFTRLVYGHLSEDCPDRSKLEIVLKETQRLENMVKEMLDFSRPLELHLTEVDVDAFIQESLLLVQQAAQERGVRLQNGSILGIAPICFDPVRMRQVVINLVMNAIQASPEGETIEVHCTRKRSALILDVVDRGCGIPPEKKQAIFLPFVTTKKEGTGLGLPIVKKIVEAHRGSLEVLDNPRKGVTFRVTVPCGCR